MKTEISSNNLILRKYETNFAPLLFEAAKESSGGEFTRWMPWCHEDYILAESESFIEKSIENWEDESQFGFAVFDTQTSEFLGGVGLNQPNKIHGFYNLGYWVRTSRQNRGIASKAARILAQTAFDELPINRLEMLIATGNIPSQKAAAKSGAMREGILRSRLVIGDGIHDAVIFSFVRTDFEAKI